MADANGKCGVSTTRYKVAILWRGDQEARRAATRFNNRYCRIFDELIALGMDAQPLIYADEVADEVRQQLMTFDGVLVWVNPIHEGQTREALDGVLREVAATGPWVSAHPEVILKMGVKEVLHRTKHLGWGTDTHLYRTMADFMASFPLRLRSCGPRVLKQNRGNAGQGVWKVEVIDRPVRDASLVSVLQARRGSMPENLPLEDFMARCEPYFGSGGCIVDQPFQPRLPEGMIRCYMGVDRVVGFGHQLIKALIAPPAAGPESPAAQPGPRIMHPADAAAFQALRTKMETEWTPQMMTILGIDAASLPIIWDADFLYGPRTASGEDSYVLCEINVSSVFAIPDQAPAAIAQLDVGTIRGTDRFCSGERATSVQSNAVRVGTTERRMKENVMRVLSTLLVGANVLVFGSAAWAQEVDWQKVDDAFGRKAAVVAGDVHRYGFPRTDLNVTLDGVTIKPALALGGWVAFKPMHGEVMVMGDLVLLETEINPVMAKLIENGLEITAVHNHLLRANPATFYMHVGGHGDPVKMATAIHDALAESKTPLSRPPQPRPPPAIDLDTAQLDQIIGVKGQTNGGVYQFGVPRRDPITKAE